MPTTANIALNKPVRISSGSISCCRW
jgi:hypothetical protein